MVEVAKQLISLPSLLKALFSYVKALKFETHKHKAIGAVAFFAFSLSFYANPLQSSTQTTHSIAFWPMNRNLSQSTIISILNGKDGMLWIATLDGITRFDGHSFFDFRSYKSGPGFIESTNIVAIIEDRAGNIFAASRDAGLLAYNENTSSFSLSHWNGEKVSLSAKISSAFHDKNGSIWIGYENGQVSHVVPHLKSAKHFANLGSSSISDFSTSSTGEVLAATITGEIYKFSDDKGHPKKLHISDSCLSQLSNLVEISSADGDLIWVGTRGNGLLLLDLRKNSCKKILLEDIKRQTSQNASVHQVLFEPETNIGWVGTDQGLYRIDGDRITYFHTSNTSLANNEIISISKGNDGILWIGTYSGLNYLVETEFDSFGIDLEESLHSIVAIDSSRQQGTWIASYDGLFNFDSNTKDHHPLDRLDSRMNFTNKKIMSIHIDSRGIWVGYRSSGLEFYSEEKKEIISYDNSGIRRLSSNAVSSILTIATGETLVGTYGAGLNGIAKNGAVEFHTGGSQKVVMLFETEDENIWVGTESGFYQFGLESKTLNEVDTHSLAQSYRTDPIIWAMAESPNGDLWLGTKHHGLFLWPRKNRSKLDLSEISPLEGIPESIKTIYSVQIDKLGYLWCSTNMGLARFEPATGKTKIFGKRFGLHDSEFDFGVSHKDIWGRLYFGGSKGYIRFDPASLDVEHPASRVTLTSIILSNQKTISPLQPNTLKNLQLTHKDYFVTFEFSVLDFVDPENNRFRYTLENFDPQWIENGTRNTATYTNLPPGDYVLRVQGANSAGVWNRDGIALNVRVLPPPWRTWWAYCIYGSILLLLFWIARRAYDSYAIERRAQQLAREFHEAEEKADDDMQEHLELQDDLVKSAYRHNVATLGLMSDCISFQSDYLPDDITREATEGSLKRLAALSTLEECLYHQSDGPYADLHKYTDILISHLLKTAPVEPETITTINEVTPSLIAAELASPLCIIIYELLENSVQHAFEPDSPANYIQIKLEIDETGTPQERHYKLTVRDSGVGIPDNILRMAQETCGLSLVRSIVNKLSGALHISCENGSAFLITFPAPPI